MKKYYLGLTAITLALVLASFCLMWFSSRGLFLIILSVLPIYFAIVTGLMHYGIVSSFYKDPRTFVKNFLGITVGSLFLHLAILFLWSLTHIQSAKTFIIGFCICYVTYLLFETISLILVVHNKRKENE